MQKTPEEILKEKQWLINAIDCTKNVAEAVELLNQYLQPLEQSNQLLLDEVNRLNGVVEKQANVIKALRDE